MRPELIDTREVATRLKLPPSGVRSLAKRRLLPSVKTSHTRQKFDWHAVRLVLARLTIWEHLHGQNSEIDGKEILTPEEMAARLGFTEHKLRALTRKRFLPHIKLGRIVRYDLGSVQYARENLISVRECARRLGITRPALTAITGPCRVLPILRFNKRCLRYHWPSVEAALAKAAAKSTVVPICPKMFADRRRESEHSDQ